MEVADGVDGSANAGRKMRYLYGRSMNERSADTCAAIPDNISDYGL